MNDFPLFRIKIRKKLDYPRINTESYYEVDVPANISRQKIMLCILFFLILFVIKKKNQINK